MKTVCITLGGEREQLARGHFATFGLHGVEFFRGFDADKLGLLTSRVYAPAGEGSGHIMRPSRVGCWLAHRALWGGLALDHSTDEWLVLEDDARLPLDWRTRFDQAHADAGGFDILYVGSCCTADKPRTLVRGEVYDLRYPMATHAYVVRRSALATLIDTTDAATCHAPIDLSMIAYSLPRLTALTVLPRIFDQHDTDLPE